jgi:D-alanine-D-alanine ligase
MKIRVGVLYGGKTTEHEVSIITAVQSMGFLNPEKYDVIPMYLTKENEMYTGEPLKEMEVYKEPELLKRYCKNVVCYNKDGALVLQNKKGIFKKIIKVVDIVIPCVHGYNMEDGNIEGMLETYGVPYTGSDIYGCTVGQDKVFQKQILASSGISVPKYTWFYDNEYFEDNSKILSDVKKLGYPVIVKPARQGSSIGIKLANNEEELKEAVEEATKYDEKILVEEAISNVVELNCSVLGSTSYMETSSIEQVMGKDDILSFNDKYIGSGAKKGVKGASASKGMLSANRVIPAEIPDALAKEIAETSKKVFRELGASGVVRIDYLYDKKAKKYYVNELNTIPGSLSFYLWTPLNKEYDELLDDMINIAVKRYKKKLKKTTTFESNILSNFDGTKGTKGLKGKLRQK